MKWFFILLFFLKLNIGLSQQSAKSILVEKSEFKIVSGMCLVGVGFTLQPIFIRNRFRSFYHYPEFTIPVTLGISVTVSGILDAIKKERNFETIKN